MEAQPALDYLPGREMEYVGVFVSDVSNSDGSVEFDMYSEPDIILTEILRAQKKTRHSTVVSPGSPVSETDIEYQADVSSSEDNSAEKPPGKNKLADKMLGEPPIKTLEEDNQSPSQVQEERTKPLEEQGESIASLLLSVEGDDDSGSG
jgi:hypothetical protein